jgi:hypothetical protein
MFLSGVEDVHRSKTTCIAILIALRGTYIFILHVSKWVHFIRSRRSFSKQNMFSFAFVSFHKKRLRLDSNFATAWQK